MNATGGKYGNALHAALYRGKEAVVKMLLENGAEVNAEGGEYGNALQTASQKGNEAIVKLLLENGADVNAKGGKYGHALHAALYRGNNAIVKLLLENGAEVNAGVEDKARESRFVRIITGDFALLSHIAFQLRDKVPCGTHVKHSIPYPRTFTGKDIVVCPSHFFSFFFFSLLFISLQVNHTNTNST